MRGKTEWLWDEWNIDHIATHEVDPYEAEEVGSYPSDKGMPVQKKKRHKLPVATAWPDEQVTDEEFAQWTETHSLEKLLGTAKSVPIKPPSQSPTGGAKHKQLERVRLALRMTPEEL